MIVFYKCRAFLYLSFFLALPKVSFSQVDSLELTSELVFGRSSDVVQVQHLFTNRRGLLNDEQTDFYFLAGGKLPIRINENIGVEIAGSFAVNTEDIFLQEYYLDFRFKKVHFVVGAQYQTIGVVNERLSSNSFGLTTNARPIPSLNIVIPEYVPLGFTKNFLEVKGNFSHGWLENDRFIQNPFVHTKSFYVRGGGKRIKAYVGGGHFVIWGGTGNDNIGDLSSSFGDFLEVVIGREADEGNTIETTNRLGSHIGILDFGVEVDLNRFDLLINLQKPVEDRSGLIPRRNKDELITIALRNKKETGFFSNIILEYIDSRFQSGIGPPDSTSFNQSFGFGFRGRDDYHNNFLYQNGWSFHGFSLGNSLFTSEARGANFFQPEGFEVFFVNNRVQGVHLGVDGNLNKSMQYKFLATYTQNLGTYAGAFGGRFRFDSPEPDPDYFFTPGLNQFYFLVELDTQLPWIKDLALKTGLGVDVGEIYDAVGGIVGLKYNGLFQVKKPKTTN